MPSVVENRITLPNDRTSFVLLAEAVSAFSVQAGLGPRSAHDLRLVLEELVTNTMTHGYGPAGTSEGGGMDTIDIVMRSGGEGGVQAELRDRARPFNPLAVLPPRLARRLQDRPLGGLGVATVRRLIRGGSYRREHGCNILTLELREAPP